MVRDPVTGAVQIAADYSELGWLLLTVTGLTLALPLLTIFVVNRSPLRSKD